MKKRIKINDKLHINIEIDHYSTVCIEFKEGRKMLYCLMGQPTENEAETLREVLNGK